MRLRYILSDAAGHERKKAARLTDEIYNHIWNGQVDSKLLALKRQWREEAEQANLHLEVWARKLLDDDSTVAWSNVTVLKLRSASDMQWLMTQFAQHLVDNGYAPPAWDADVKPPSMDYITEFFVSSRYEAKERNELAIPRTCWMSLLYLQLGCLRAFSSYSPPERGGVWEVMCFEGFHNEAVLMKAAKLIESTVTFVPYTPPSIAPVAIAPVADPVSDESIHDAFVEANDLTDDIDNLEGELSALLLENSPNVELVRQKEEERARLCALREEARGRALDLYQGWATKSCAAATAALPENGPLRAALNMNFFLTRLSLYYDRLRLTAYKVNLDRAPRPPFERVLEFLHSTDPKPKLVRRRAKLRATFTDSEWQFFADVNTKCFNALFNRAPPMVDKRHELVGYDMSCEDAVTWAANVLKLDVCLTVHPRYGATKKVDIFGSSSQVSLPVFPPIPRRGASDDAASAASSSEEPPAIVSAHPMVSLLWLRPCIVIRILESQSGSSAGEA